MGCGCKKANQQAAGARAARPQRVSRNQAAAARAGRGTYTYHVLPIDDSQDVDGEAEGESYYILAEAQKRIRDLGPAYYIVPRKS